MSKTGILQELPNLTKEERPEIRVKLAEVDNDGWLAEDAPVTDEERRLIDARLAEHEANPQSAISCEEFKARLSGELLQGWASLRLEELVTARQSKKPAATKPEAGGGFVPYLDIQAIEKGEVSSYAEAAGSRLGTDEDVFVVWDGARSGSVGLGRKGAIGSSIMALQPKAGERAYLHRWLQSQLQQVNPNTCGTGIPHVDPEVFWELGGSACPPLADQQKIVRRVEALFRLADQIEARFQEAQALVSKLTSSLLARACRGQLVPQDPTDEPAEELLQRIRQPQATP